METSIVPSSSFRFTSCRLLIVIALTIAATCLSAEPVPVVCRQGAIHGFLLLKDENGKEIAVGDQTNQVRGSVIRSRTIFQFRDGSVDDEETVYRQGATFQLMRDHHIQKGPAFPKPADVTIDVAKGEVSWVDTSGNQSKSQHMNLPRDLANGMVPLLVQNFPHGAAQLKVSYLAAGAKPRIVQLTITPDRSEEVLVGWSDRKAHRFNVHTELGGIAGVVAPLIGKQPPDAGVWVVEGSDAPVPAFIKLAAPFYEDGPEWTVVLTAPSWPGEDSKK